MNAEEMRIAIAEAHGKGHRQVTGMEALSLGVKPCSYVQTGDAPDYLKNINAMHQVIGNLSFSQRATFAGELQKLMKVELVGFQPGSVNDDLRDLSTLILSPADILAEAFLRTLNLWKECP